MRRPRTGTEPVTARSPLRLRLILASAALVVFTAATVRLAMGAHSAGPHDSPSATVLLVLAVVCGVLALAAILDLVVLRRRMRSQRTTGA
ncbi:DUF6343 family protein [Streptomyces decoyicus]|uniref:DUF6343 family protein n=1 Tax=Streptomyces decoyicus TaxID=249567 RepID=UPI0004AAB2E2|nr:DUF6343 family protein [Streptomyces decoyicus]KOG41137.1 hypothetical protein ADK74_21460 [Streptomyces decoyicus]QZY20032.1 DUF6343 family protein [Streptomyces decoyicus]